jgi:ribonuclease HI
MVVRVVAGPSLGLPTLCGLVPRAPILVTAAILVSPSRIKLRYAARLHFTSEIDKCTNNITEYEAILLGLHKLRAIGVQTCVLHIDSKVVPDQIEKEYITREPTLEKYLALVRRMENNLKGFTV